MMTIEFGFNRNGIDFSIKFLCDNGVYYDLFIEHLSGHNGSMKLSYMLYTYKNRDYKYKYVHFIS